MKVGYVLVCDPVSASAGLIHDQICPASSTGQFYKATPHEALVVDAALAPVFDPPSAVDIGIAFSVTFTTTLILWMAAKGFGTVLGLVRAQVR